MPRIQIQRTIAAPREVVFDLASDFPQAANHVSGIDSIEMLTDGPVAIGTRFKETRTMFGRQSTEEMEVIAFEPNQMYTLAANSCGARFETTFRFDDTLEDPQAPATRLIVDMNVRAQSMFAKLMSPLSKLMSGTIKKCIESDLDSIQQKAESKSVQAV